MFDYIGKTGCFYQLGKNYLSSVHGTLSDMIKIDSFHETVLVVDELYYIQILNTAL